MRHAQVRILSTLNRELLKPSASVALHRHSNALVDILPPEADSSISLLDQSERPDTSYSVRVPQPHHAQFHLDVGLAWPWSACLNCAFPSASPLLTLSVFRCIEVG